MSTVIREHQFAALPNGMRLHFASAGTPGKPLLLFLHGFPEHWFAWHQQLPVFADTHYAVAPDLRGFNLSDMPDSVDAYKAKHIQQDIEQLIAALGYERCTIVAHDWGGAIAWNLAITRPALLQQLLIINATHPYPFARDLAHDPTQQAASQYMNWLRASGSEAALAKDDFRVLEKLMLGLGERAAWFDAATRERYHACWSRGLTGAVNYYRATPLHPPTDTEPGAKAITLDPAQWRCTVPVRMIWGERDPALLPGLLEGLPELVDDLEIVRIPEASHWVAHEVPDQVNQLLRNFLLS